MDGAVLGGKGRPSAETSLHTVIYRRAACMRGRFCMCIRSGTRCCREDLRLRGMWRCEGYELLKGLAGVATHEHRGAVPIIENSQDYASLADEVEDGVT